MQADATLGLTPIETKQGKSITGNRKNSNKKQEQCWWTKWCKDVMVKKGYQVGNWRLNDFIERPYNDDAQMIIVIMMMLVMALD